MQRLPNHVLQRPQQQGKGKGKSEGTSPSREGETQAARGGGRIGRGSSTESGEFASPDLSNYSTYATSPSISPSSPSRAKRDEVRGGLGVGGGVGQEVESKSSLAVDTQLRSPARQREAGTTSREGSAEAVPSQFMGASSEADVDGFVKPRRKDFAFQRSASPPVETHSGDEVPSSSYLSPTWPTR